MTLKELLDILQMLSAIKSAMLMGNARMPDHLHDQLIETINTVRYYILNK
jgi:hypothetical protein